LWGKLNLLYILVTMCYVQGLKNMLKNCSIDNSIIIDECKIYAPVHISESIIGSGSEILGNEGKKTQFLLGERSKINI